jgi:DNA-3-methyladenine glycosylase
MSTPLPTSFFAREADVVAEELLGTVIVSGGFRLRIVETEAYLGPHDLACHTAKGRTARNEVMFGPPGVLYVYFIYGMYDMLNIVTGAENGQAVLLRAAEPFGDTQPFAAGTSSTGPGKLARALGLTTRGDNGLVLGGSRFAVHPGPAPACIARGPRIGVDYAGVWRDEPLRFCDADSRFLSRPVLPAPRAPRPTSPPTKPPRKR